MTSPQLPSLAANVRYRGKPTGPEVEKSANGSTTLWARYLVQGFAVSIGWEVNHPQGSFREPNKLDIDFDPQNYAESTPVKGGAAGSLEGITTALLRSIPMAHARALMRDHHEQLSVADIRRDITPFPSRVETDRDYTHVASAYVALGEVSVEPIKRLAEWSGESIDTWSARLRRARSKGILEGKGRQSRITPAFTGMRDEIWSTMRERKDEPDGHQQALQRS